MGYGSKISPAGPWKAPAAGHFMPRGGAAKFALQFALGPRPLPHACPPNSSRATGNGRFARGPALNNGRIKPIW